MSSFVSVSALLSCASFNNLCVSRICSRICSSRENFRARRSREAFSGSRLASASESRNIRSSSSFIWAAAFCWLKPIVSRSETAARRARPLSSRPALVRRSFFSSSKTAAALAASFLVLGRGQAERHAPIDDKSDEARAIDSQAMKSCDGLPSKTSCVRDSRAVSAASRTFGSICDHFGHRIDERRRIWSYFRRRQESIAREFRDDSRSGRGQTVTTNSRRSETRDQDHGVAMTDHCG